MNKSAKVKASAVTLGVATVLTTALPSFAWGWSSAHPRRAEVLQVARDSF